MGLDLGGFGQQLSAAVGNTVNSLVNRTNGSAPQAAASNNLGDLATNNAALNAMDRLRQQGATPSSPAQGVTAGEIGQDIALRLIRGNYRNPDGTPNGQMNSTLLSALEATMESIDPNNPTSFRGGTEGALRNVNKAVLYDWGTRDPNVAAALAGLTDAELDEMVDNLMSGNFGALGRAASLALISSQARLALAQYAPWLLDAAAALGLGRPVTLAEDGEPIYKNENPSDWPRMPAPVSTIAAAPDEGNVGHAGHMEVWLGGLKFELPPAIQSNMPIHGGAAGPQPPDTQVGIPFTHMANVATIMIPGREPVIQSLGIQGHMVEFVGAFLGYDHERFLNADLKNKDYYNDDAPDPLYIKPGAMSQDLFNKTMKGGSWAVSRQFQTKVASGEPLEFKIFSGVVTIRYRLIVTVFKRYYTDDSRTYYLIKGLAIDGDEWDGRQEATPTIKKQPTNKMGPRVPKKQTGRSKGKGKGKGKGKSSGQSTGGSTTETPTQGGVGTKDTLDSRLLVPSPRLFQQASASLRRAEITVAAFESAPDIQRRRRANNAITQAYDVIQRALAYADQATPGSQTATERQKDQLYVAKHKVTKLRERYDTANLKTAGGPTTATASARTTSVVEALNRAGR